MKVVGIGGEPATGKSTLIKSFMTELGPAKQEFKFGCLYGYRWRIDIPKSLFEFNDVFILGLYPEGETFGGTDRLSMAVQPMVEVFLEYQKKTPSIIIFEGDRLFCKPTLRHIQKVAWRHLFIVLTATPEEKERRHKQRQDDQSQSFLKSRVTKINNIRRAFLGDMTFLRNQTDLDLVQNQAVLRDFVFSAD